MGCSIIERSPPVQRPLSKSRSMRMEQQFNSIWVKRSFNFNKRFERQGLICCLTYFSQARSLWTQMVVFRRQLSRFRRQRQQAYDLGSQEKSVASSEIWRALSCCKSSWLESIVKRSSCFRRGHSRSTYKVLVDVNSLITSCDKHWQLSVQLNVFKN